MKRMFHKIWRTGGLAVLLMTSTPLASLSAERPVLVSPRSSGASPATAEPCSTFSWAAVPGAASYELALVSLDPAAGREDNAVLSALLPAGATSWTPPGEQCLEAGKRYSWTVTAEHGLGRRTSSDRHEFTVRKNDLETALERILGRLAEEGKLTVQELSRLQELGVGAAQRRFADASPLPIRPIGSAQAPAEPGPQGTSPSPRGPMAGDTASILAENGDTFGVWASGVEVGLHGEVDNMELGTGVAGFGPTHGVYGEGDTYGVFGEGGGATGVQGTGYTGVRGDGTLYGVRGRATATSGENYGVYGESDSSSGRGVIGKGTFGVIGEGTTTGVEGSGGSIGVVGAGSTYGVFGAATGGAGAFDIYAGGTAANYGPFTGSHEARLDDRYGELIPGMVVSVTGETQVRRGVDGAVSLSSSFPTVTLSHRADDRAVFGVLVAETELPDDHWYRTQAADGDVFGTINSLGEGRVWVTDINGPVRAGDYLTTSDVLGHAQRQDSDICHSYTVGKVIETVDWSAVTDTVEHNGVTYKKALLAVVYTSG